MRTKLICLSTLDAELARTVGIAWAGLSRACHHHAYELAPTWAETAYLVSLVERLETSLNRRDTY